MKKPIIPANIFKDRFSQSFKSLPIADTVSERTLRQKKCFSKEELDKHLNNVMKTRNTCFYNTQFAVNHTQWRMSKVSRELSLNRSLKRSFKRNSFFNETYTFKPQINCISFRKQSPIFERLQLDN